MSEPLTAAEQAAGDVMHAEIVAEGVITTADPESFDRTARAVVAAVRPHLAAEALTAFAVKVDGILGQHPAPVVHTDTWWYREGLSDAASIAREDAAEQPARSTPREN